MMKDIFFLLLILSFLQCVNPKIKTEDGRVEIKIIAIDSLKLEDFYVILIDKGVRSDTCQLISLKEELTGKYEYERIELGKTYKMNLKLLKTTKKVTGVSQRLYERDIYIEGEFVFPVNRLTYETVSLKGLYYY